MRKGEPTQDAARRNAKKSGPITMEMVARIAGVSQVSVSRALNHPDKVAPETLARINEAIRVTGYVPNLVAGALAKRRSGIIAALIPSITNITYSSFLRPFIVAMREAGYQVILAETGYSEAEEQLIVQSLLSRQPEGMLLTGVHHSAECRRMLLGVSLPVVEVWDLSETPIDVSVGFSQAGTGRAMAQFARDKGRDTAAVLTASDHRALRRKDAFCAAFTARGGTTPHQLICDGPASIQAGRQGLARLIEGGFAAGFIHCSSDLLAHGALIEAQARGIAVPDTMAIAGFGDQEFSAYTIPSITTVRVDRSLLGQKAAATLLDQIAGHPPTERSIDIGFQIISRQST